MDKNNKYYEIIESLVKNHKKFPGCEPILDDIIDDVFSHSEVIINSVSNESVVNSYLEKVVSTSIITVPKKMGYNRFSKHKVINPEQDSQIEQVQQNVQQEEIPAEKPVKVNMEFVEKMINLAEAPQKEIAEEEDDFSELSEQLLSEDVSVTVEEDAEKSDTAEEVLDSAADKSDSEIKLNEESFDVSEDFSINTEPDEISELNNPAPEEEEALFSESPADELQDERIVTGEPENVELSEEEIPSTEEFAEEIRFNESDEVDDIKPVDSVLNVDAEALSEISTDTEDLKESEVNDDFLPENFEEIREPEDNTEALDFADYNEEPQSVILDIDTNESENLLEEVELSENFEPEISEASPFSEQLQELPLDDAISSEPVDSEDENLLSGNFEIGETDSLMTEEFSVENADAPLQEFADNTLDEFVISEEDASLGDLSLNDELEQFGEDIVLQEEAAPEQNTNDGYVRPDYSVFAYSPADVDMEDDSEEIAAEIVKMNEKYPTLKVAEIFNLKYKENLSVADVAKKLGIETKDVLSVLTKIADLV